MGYVYLPNVTYTNFVNGTDRYFQSTTFFLKDCTIYPKAKDESNIRSWIDSKLYLQSGDSKLRLTSDNSITYEGKESKNDTSDGITATISNHGSFNIEDKNEKLLFSVNGNSQDVINRSGLSVGDDTLGYYNVTLKKGSVVFENAIYNAATNAPNNSIFVDYSDNKLKFKDNTGTIHTITLS